MKKLLVFAILLVVPLALFGQQINFFEMPFNYNSFLYPERQFLNNPAIAAELPQSIDDMYAYLDVNRDASKDEQTGAATGVLTNRTFDTFAMASFARFVRENGSVSRLRAMAAPFLSFDNEKDDGHATAGEIETVKVRDHSFSASGSYLSASADGDSAMGYYGYLSATWDPVTEEFERTTNTADNGGAEYYSANPAGNRARTIIVSPAVTFGVTSTADAEWKGLGSRLGFTLFDQSVRYNRADTDASGFDDSLVKEEEFRTNPDWGDDDAYYDYKDQTQSLYAAVYPAMIRPLDDGRDLILSGRLDLVDGSREVFYDRDAQADESQNVLLTGSLFSSGGVFAGVRRTTDFGAEQRFGVVADVDVGFRSEEDLDVAGASTFAAENSDSLPESPATDPDNGDVVATGETDLDIDSDLGFLMGLEWRIGAPVVLYLTGSATVNFDYARYRYFDTTTNTVWTEWDARNDLAFNLGSDFGIQFTMPNGPFITVSGALPNLVGGNGYINFDPMPGSDAGDSPGIVSDKSTSNGQGFTVQIDVTVRR